MSADPQELEAARFVRAALVLIRDSFPSAGALDAMVSRWQDEAGEMIDALKQAAPPWEPERPEAPLPWSDVIAGDTVKAPNGQWYRVDSWSRIGRQVAALLEVNGATVKTVREGRDKVLVRRGPAGQAVDMFRNAGFNLEQIGAGR